MRSIKLQKLLYSIAALLYAAPIPESHGLVLHCDPNTDMLRESEFINYSPEMKKWLMNENKLTNGRLGTLHFVNWQDRLLSLKTKTKRKCRWKMRSFISEEETSFNDKFYVGEELNADPVLNTHFYRIVSCETDQCVQHFNIFTRPIAQPDFPVQVYYTKARDVKCNLHLMEDSKKGITIADHNPPYRFEWTGPKDCPRNAWNNPIPSPSCVRYSRASAVPPPPCTNFQCEFSIATSPSGQPGYARTNVRLHSKMVNGLLSEYSSELVIQHASEDHDGVWRCIVYDRFEISSHPSKEGMDFLHTQDIIHRGIVQIHCKDQIFAVCLPLVILIVTCAATVICILCCKQCTDYQETDESNDPPVPADKSNEAVAVATANPTVSNVRVAESATRAQNAPQPDLAVQSLSGSSESQTHADEAAKKKQHKKKK